MAYVPIEDDGATVLNDTECCVGGIPEIVSLFPVDVEAGGLAFTLFVFGNNFVSDSVVIWNGEARTTTFVDSTHLTAAITAADIEETATIAVYVFNPTPGCGASNTQFVAITGCDGGTPNISSLSPSNTDAATGSFILTVNGTNFRSDSVVRWNGSDRVTSFISSIQLTAVILAGDVAAVGSAVVTVNNPDPGCGISNSISFTINCVGGVPSISSLSPSSISAGSVDFTLTVNGTNFRPDSVVRWNGSDRATTYVSSIQLTATILAADVADSGTGSVTVNNPGIGCGASFSSTFTINGHGPVIGGGLFSGSIGSSGFVLPYAPSVLTGTSPGIPMCVAGRARNLALRLSTDLGGSQSIELDTYKNSAQQSLVIPAALGAPTGNYLDTSNFFDMVAGDLFKAGAVPVNTPTGIAGWSMEYPNADNAAIAGLSGASGGTSIPAGATRYWNICGNTFNVTENPVLWPCPVTGPVKKFYVRINDAQPGDGDLVLTFRKGVDLAGMADQILVVTIPAGSPANTYVDITNFFNATEGVHLLSVKIVNNSASPSAHIVGASFEVATVDNSMILGGQGNPTFQILSSAGDVFFSPFGSGPNGTGSAAGLYDMIIPRDGILAALYYYYSVVVGGTQPQVITTVLNGLDQLQLISIPHNSAIAIYGSTTQVPVVQGDRLRIKYRNMETTGGGPAGSWGMKLIEP